METIHLVKRKGILSMDKSFDFLCSRLPNGEYVATIKRKQRPRSLNQNALLWMWYTCLQDATGEGKDAWHDYYKRKFLSERKVVNERECVFTRSTTTLTTAQMSEYMTKVQADAASEFGCTLPLPQDRYYSEFVEYYKDR